MGLFQRALETFDANTSRVGVYDSEKAEPLAPIGHIIAKAQIEITLDQDGQFISAVAVDKAYEKTIIPATEESAGRSGTRAYERAHPLCDKLSYLSAKAEENYYIPALEAWANSPYGNPKLNAVLRYVKNGTILDDLKEQGVKLKGKGAELVRWRIIGLGDDSGPCWEDRKLFQSYIQYQNEANKNGAAFCMVTGSVERAARQHAKGVVAYYGNAKLISANDKTGFTFLGRFMDETQAATVSYSASQKAHNALRWLIANQGAQIVFGGRIFLCWNPQGIRVANPVRAFRPTTAAQQNKPSDFRAQLLATLRSYRKDLQIKGNEKAVIAFFDASTKGRLSLTYYNEINVDSFHERLSDWDKHCCWWNGQFGIQAPDIDSLVDCAYGTQRKEKEKTSLVTDDKVMKQALQTLLVCRLNEGAFPQNIQTALVQRAGTPQNYERGIWEKILYSACAALQMTIYQKKGEDVMSWDLNTPDRSFQFGRLLAVMDWAEEYYYWLTGEEGRQTNAMKMMSVFRQRPLFAYEQVNRQLITAYLPRLKRRQRDRYRRLTAEIVYTISTLQDADIKSPLSELYLLGYDLQRRALYNNSDNEKEKTDNE